MKHQLTRRAIVFGLSTAAVLVASPSLASSAVPSRCGRRSGTKATRRTSGTRGWWHRRVYNKLDRKSTWRRSIYARRPSGPIAP